MSRTRLLRSGLAGLGLAILGIGCAPDGATAPAPADVPSMSFVKSPPLPVLSSNGKASVPIVTRKKALPADITVTQNIDSTGGVIEIKEAGFRVTFSPGAVAQSTPITVTAYAGAYISYGFGPHGLQFMAPVTIEQDMKGTNMKDKVAGIESIHGVYAPDGQADLTPDGRANVSEILGADTRIGIDPVRGKAELKSTKFIIRHFSGYMLMGG